MDGITLVSNFTGGEADLTNEIARVGKNDTPFFHAVQKAVPSLKAQTNLGHAWDYEEAPDGDDDNAQFEGSSASDATTEILGNSSNHYQIIEHVYGVSGSAEDRVRRDGNKELVRQGALKSIKHRKTIEKRLFSADAPVQRVGKEGDAGAVAGKMAGIGHWCTVQNSVTLTAEAFAMKHLRDMLRLVWEQGMPVSHLFMNTFQKDALDDILDSKTRTGQGQRAYDANNIEMIKNLMYAPNVKVITSVHVPQDTIYGVNMQSLALVYQRLTKSYNLARTGDAINKQLISELTLRVNNPYAVCKLSGLTTS